MQSDDFGCGQFRRVPTEVVASHWRYSIDASSPETWLKAGRPRRLESSMWAKIESGLKVVCFELMSQTPAGQGCIRLL
ncbi:unnamed protein product [Orchesella dallaii]|uniref:Uncharacterized protein n=1 Tax=Orchesella dallaii TaxID=48710 RepID=A0ABP1Q1F0_9HEXA